MAAPKAATGVLAALLDHRADLHAEDTAGQAPVRPLHWAAMGDAAAAGSHIQVGICASVPSGCRMTSTLPPAR